jgi:probable HAF family extracellular repeat protein
VAGWVGSLSGHRSAAIFSNGKIKVLGTLQPPIPIQAGFSEANDINNAMQVVGRATANARRGAINRPVHAFLYDGSMHDLGTLGGANSVAVDINEAGQIVGNSDTAGSTTQHAFIYANGFMTDMGSVPGFPYLIANSINNLGQATGTMLVSAPFPDGPTPGRAFLYENGVIHQLPLLPNTDTSWAGGINDNGQIVGRCGSKAFLYSGGVMTDLGKLVDPTDVLPLEIVSGVAINNAGQILARARSKTGSPGYWYLRLDPVSPPPSR